ncbi:MAG TPA: 50S ribosomal protein L7/L12 [Planctomycetaceae bacterium]|nr:50S ribosomal protein L7/L12 [Planctomycetaceae bacterium]
MSETTKEFCEEIKALGDKIVAMTLKQAKELSDYLEEVHGIKAAAGGAVMVAGPAAGAEAAAPVEEKTDFDVILDDFGANKIEIIKIVRAATGASLGDAKSLVESAGPNCKIKSGIPKEEAEKMKKELEEKGAKVSVK